MADKVPPGMMWCSVCKDYAFIKMRLTTTASLDCGHMGRIGRDETKESSTTKPQVTRVPPAERKVEKQRRNYVESTPRSEPVSSMLYCSKHRINYYHECSGCTAELAQNASSRPHRTTANVAGTLRDLLNGK